MSSVPIPWQGARNVATPANSRTSGPFAAVTTARRSTILASIPQSVPSAVADATDRTHLIGVIEKVARLGWLWSSPGMPKRREKTVDNGDARIVDDTAGSPAEGLELAQVILADCPDGYHPWRVQVQKSDRGRRSSVRVWFKRNAVRSEAPE